jgi:hypothetical protein
MEEEKQIEQDENTNTNKKSPNFVKVLYWLPIVILTFFIILHLNQNSKIRVHEDKQESWSSVFEDGVRYKLKTTGRYVVVELNMYGELGVLDCNPSKPTGPKPL